MRVWVGDAGVVGPGLDGWEASRAVLAGRERYVAAPTQYPPIAALPPAERRRLGVPIKLALGAGLDAFRNRVHEAKTAATVFTSSGGDGANVHAICQSLASREREVSPTRFHNAVHNAAAGYWSITTGTRAPSTSLCCHDSSFAAGLVEAAAFVASEKASVALMAYDHCYPEPLNAVRSIGADFGAALILMPRRDDAALACLDIDIVHAPLVTTTMSDPGLERLRTGVPACRALPLLTALARGVEATVILDYLDMHLAIRCAPAHPPQADTGAAEVLDHAGKQ